jgi:prolyl oligopeptidase
VRALATRRTDAGEDFHGTWVADPYHWLEEDNDDEVKAWVRAQNEQTEEFLARVPERAALRARLSELFEIGWVDLPTVVRLNTGGFRYFFTRRSGTEDQPRLIVRDGLHGAERVLFDPNRAPASVPTSLDWYYPSPDGRYLAYGTSVDGSEDSVLRVRDVESGTDLDVEIPRTRHASVAWTPSADRFYYTRYPSDAAIGQERYNRRVYEHQLGRDPARDPMVFGADSAATDHPNVSLSPSGRWLVVHVHKSWGESQAFLADTRAPERHFCRLTPELPNSYEVTAQDGTLYVLTNEGAPRFALYAVDPEHTERDAWKLILAEHATDVLSSITICQSQIFASYLHAATSRLQRFALDGTSRSELPLPSAGTSDGFSALPDGDEVFFGFESFASPPAIYRIAVLGDTPELWQSASVAFDPTPYTVTSRIAISKDGTEVPYQLVHRRDLSLESGQNPTLLYGYGGFNVSLMPRFSRANLCFIERAGVYVQANLRGGGEFGARWHEAGQLAQKQNTFDDFRAVAEDLLRSRVTCPSKLAVHGRSNGGLLVAAAVTQYPELFKVAVCGVPLTDMLRYERFLIAKLWVPEYGSAQDPEQFGFLHAYSPYHRVRSGTDYPAVLVTTAESDTRVAPLHARKFAAALAWATNSDRPILLRTELHAGHGAGAPISKLVAEWADIHAFLCAELGAHTTDRASTQAR